MGVTALPDDFNVMTARGLPKPQVQVITTATDLAAGGMLAIFALAEATAGGLALGRYDLVLTDAAITVSGPVIAVRFA